MSLLNKAKEMREPDSEGGKTPSELGIVFDKDSGISEEDQKDILVQIDKIATQSRITATPELLVIKAKKRGYALPFVVNAGALFVLASGLFLLSYFFRQSESELKGETALIRSAEGKLIQAIKQETEAQLRAKEAEIASIQNRLTEIDKERKDLQSNMDAKLKQKEEELRKSLEKELEEERRKLRAQGLSEEIIAERLKKFEEEKNKEIERQLAAFRKDAESEKLKLEENLKKLQNDFQNNLASLSAERQKIAEESRKREEALRAQLEERNKSIEADRTKAQEQLSKVEAELKKLGEQKEKSVLVENQILGFYNTAKTNLLEANFEAAKKTLSSFRTYLNEETIMSLPGIQKRREIDLLSIDALSTMIEDSLRRQKEVSTISEMLKIEVTVEDIKKSVALGNEAVKAGNLGEAEKHFTAALSRVPDVLTSHQFFLNRKMEEDRQKKDLLEETARKAEAAFKAGNHKEAVAVYTKALEFLPVPAADSAALVKNIQKSGFEILLEEQKQLETENSSTLITDGDAAMKSADYERAVSAYITVLQKFPVSKQSGAAIDGIRKAVRSQGQLIESSGSSARNTIASLQAEKDTLERTIKNLEEESRQLAAMRTDKQEQDQYLQTLRNRITELEAQNSELKKNQVDGSAVAAIPVIPPQTLEELKRLTAVETEYNRLKGDYQEAQNTIRRNNEEIRGHKETISRLSAVEDEYNRVKKAYTDYAAKEDGTLAAKGNAGIVETKLYLDAFLVSENIKTSFPAFGDRIKRYDKAFQDAGKNQALMEATDIVYRVATTRSKEEVDSFLAAELEKKRGNAEMVEFIQTVKKIRR